MRFFIQYIFAVLIITSCIQTQDKGSVAQKQSDINSSTSIHFKENVGNFGGITILNTGPRGGFYQSSNRENFRYTVFRVEIFNDTIIPIKLDIKFPKSPIGLLPDSTIVFEAFLVPDKFIPDSIQDDFNFGARLEDLFESGHKYQFDLSTSIQPENQRTLYVGILLKSKIIDGTTRAKLFVEGQDQDAPFFKVSSRNRYKLNKNPINLVYGISVAAPKYHTLISCGQIKIE
ncbi:hypothetical protein [Muriicola soli]|uniref:Uncharacterized protein n=1 Tax=Muriicola soli TaxID=2507538 RepID=A0A411E961_9FLAO|nr:hypothetical protein [Muriicola soli]QBA64000.1 hypothetical protein EQY75_05285 [Muriicola soli]